jgi:hypothetical protein
MMSPERESARWRKRRLIYNNDGDDVIEARPDGVEHEHDVAESLMVRRTGDTVQDFLDARSTPLIGSQVDSNWFCTAMAGLTFSHRTKLGGFHSKGVPLELVEKYGRDSLQVQLDFSREHGMEAAWSLRMNDAHDAFPMGSRRYNYGLAKFKRENPAYMMGQEGDFEKYERGNPRSGWTRLDFAIPEVRDHIFTVIEEVAENYDVDLINMEFFKYWPFFRESLDDDPVEPEHMEIMNELLRRIRRMADDVASRRGRPLLLAAQVPFSLNDSVHVGVDLETWLQEGLIDQLIPGGMYESPFRDSYTDIIALGHKYEIPVYPCLTWAFWDNWVFLALSDGKHRHFDAWLKTLYGGQPERIGCPEYVTLFNGWEGSFPSWRGVAMNLLNAGADGLYLFNPALGEPRVWREIGEVATMAGKDRLYGVDRFEGANSFSFVSEVIIDPVTPLSVGFQVGEDVGSVGARSIDFSLHLWDWVGGDDLTVKLNGASVDGLEPADPDRNPVESQWLQGNLEAKQIQRGENQLEVAVKKRGESASSSIVLDTAQLRIRVES